MTMATNISSSTAVDQFRAAIEAAGMTPPDVIEADGRLRRFASNGKKSDDAGWYLLHADGIPAGAFGDHRTGRAQSWRADIGRTLTLGEEDALRARIEALRQKRDEELARARMRAMQKAAALWRAAMPVAADHPYLVRKGVLPVESLREIDAAAAAGILGYSPRSRGDDLTGRVLVAPVKVTSILSTCELIDSGGRKSAISGGQKAGGLWAAQALPKGRGEGLTLCIAEGVATALTVKVACGHASVAALSAGNLLAVTKAMRACYPAAVLIVLADIVDATGEADRHAVEAAGAVGALLAMPDFGAGRPPGATDFNDLAQHADVQQVVSAIAAAKLIPQTADPTPPVASAQSLTLDRSIVERERTVRIRCGADITPTAITWLWPGWLPAGKLTILAGAAGTGKTTVALALAAILTTGGAWPDGAPGRSQGNVLIWSSEDVADDTLVPRLIASGADMSRCHFIEGINQGDERVPFDPAQDIPALHRAVDRIGGVSLLLIDPIVSAVAGDMHRANDVRRSLQAVVDFAEAHSCAVLGITHFAKGGAGKSPQDRVIGSQAFGALARMVLVAAKEEGTGSTRRVLARAKSNIAPDDGGVAYSLELGEIAGGIETTHAIWGGVIEGSAREILGDVEHDDEADQDGHDELQRMLVDTIRDAGGRIAAKQLQAEVRDAGHSWDAAKRLKKTLGIESMKLAMGGAWVWCLPETNP